MTENGARRNAEEKSIGERVQLRAKSSLHVFANSQLKRLYNFDSCLELESVDMVVFDQIIIEMT